MTVTVIRDADHLESELGAAGSKLSVLDFTAQWCGPCKFISPEFDRLSQKYTGTKFFKVDVDDCSDVAQDYNIRSMPTFVFVRNSNEVHRFSGADVASLEATIVKHGSADTFSGSGYTLNSATGSESTTTSASSTSQGLGAWIGNLVNSVTGGSSATSVGSEDEALNAKCEDQAKEIFRVDDKKPTCKMQVRLLDGKKMSVVLNNTVTVEQLRQYITIARPSLAEVPFRLFAGHPSKVIEDETATLEDANLANAVVLLQQAK